MQNNKLIRDQVTSFFADVSSTVSVGNLSKPSSLEIPFALRRLRISSFVFRMVIHI